MSSKKKVAAAATAVALAVSMLLGGTYAWQSVNQVALNEASDVVNPGGRLHDDFNGENKDVYVENFADEPIFARVRLEEYFEVIISQGDSSTALPLIGSLDEEKKPVHAPYSFSEDKMDGSNAEAGMYDGKSYWTWSTGGSTVYMPTFNKDKDSLDADINGTYAGPDKEVNTSDDKYGDYVTYTDGEGMTASAQYDADADDLDNGGTKAVEETHYAKPTETAALISMQQWFDNGSEPGPFWVYDEDGWVYWAQAIDPDSATGLLLDGIELTEVMDDSWYYAINVIGQFVTADDVGKADGTGFYDEEKGTPPTEKAEELLKAIGVDMGAEDLQDSLDASEGEVDLTGKTATSTTETVINDDIPGYNYLMSEGGTLKGGTIYTSNAYHGFFINNEEGWPEEGDGAAEATIDGTTFISTNNNAAVYTQAIDQPVYLKNVKISSDRVGVWAFGKEYAVTLDNCAVTSQNNAPVDMPWLNSAVAAAGNGSVIINSGTYMGDYAAYVYSSGGSIEINGGYFSGKLAAEGANSALTVKGGTFTEDPSDFVAEGYVAIENSDGTWTVTANSTGDDEIFDINSIEGEWSVKLWNEGADIESEEALVTFTPYNTRYDADVQGKVFWGRVYKGGINVTEHGYVALDTVDNALERITKDRFGETETQIDDNFTSAYFELTMNRNNEILVLGLEEMHVYINK